MLRDTTSRFLMFERYNEIQRHNNDTQRVTLFDILKVLVVTRCISLYVVVSRSIKRYCPSDIDAYSLNYETCLLRPRFLLLLFNYRFVNSLKEYNAL